MAQSNPIGVVFDFDGTLTPKEYGSLIRIVEEACLSEQANGRIAVIRQKYLEMIVRGTISAEAEKRLIHTSLKAYARTRLKKDSWQKALEGIALRQGVADKIRELTGRGIRVGIISFSIADFIETALEYNSLGGAVHRVYASQLIHNGNGEVVGWKARTVVYPYSKGVWSMVFAKTFGIAPERLIAVGDSLGDRALGLRQDLRLGIARNEEEAKMIAPFVGKAVVTEDFAPVSDWIDRQICLILSRNKP